MKKIIQSVIFSLLAIFCCAQQKEGKVVYKYKITFNAEAAMTSVSGGNGAGMPPAPGMRDMPEMPPQNFELRFGNNKMLWKQIEDERPDAGQQMGGAVIMGGAGPGQDDILFCDLTSGKKVRQQSMGDQQFLVEDSITRLKWIMSEESKKILDRVCRKATAQRIEKRMRPVMKEGKFEEEEYSDTSSLVAWFASDIPVAVGPGDVPGQLPGLIMELETNSRNAKTVYQATALTAKVDLASIKAPAKGKKVTAEGLKKEMEKMMKEMQRRGGGRNAIRGGS